LELSLTLLIQTIIIFILIAVGFTLSKLGKLDETGTKQMTTILLSIVTPCVLIHSYQQKSFNLSLAKNLGLAALVTLIVHLVAILIATLYFKKEETNRYRINIFASVYSNCGFMAIPLLTATLGEDGVFYGAMYLVIFTICYWIHGPYLFTGDKSNLKPSMAVKTPGVIGTGIALLLFVFNIKLPEVIIRPVEFLADMNTPLAMLILGCYLSKVNFKKVLSNPDIYKVSVLRLILIPILTVYLLKIFGIDPVVAKSILIPAACPVATVCTLFAAKFGLDATYSSEVVSISTIFSILTIPLIILLY